MNFIYIKDKIIYFKYLISIFLIKIISGLSLLFIGILISKLIFNLIKKIMESRNIDSTVINFLSTTIKYGIIILFSIISLSKVGVQTTSIVTVLGAAGLAIGLALQSSLSNFAAGILLVSFRHFKVNDYVDIGSNILGFITSVQLFSTTLRTLDGRIVIVPNSKILSGNIINLSTEPLKLISTSINIDRNSNIILAKNIINSVLILENRISKNNPTFINISAVTYTSIELVIKFWTNREIAPFVISNILENVNNKFRINKIYPPRYVIKIINSSNNIKR